MRSYCTIFDKNYLIQGLALYNSLKYSSRNYQLFCLCMDTESFKLLIKFKLTNLIPIHIDDLMNSQLNIVRNETTFGQFCWVCQPVFCEYLLNTFYLDMIIYQESDTIFFSDPEIIINELEGYSSCLVPHNFSLDTDNAKSAGNYCIQFNAFKNNLDGLSVLNYWKTECFKYSKNTPTLYPGQLCLDNWVDNFNGVKVINNIGAGVAPWNILQYRIFIKDQMLYVNNTPIIFYHYHAFGRYPNGLYELGRYRYTKNVITYIYSSYVNLLIDAEKLIISIDINYNFKRYYPARYNYRDIFGFNLFFVLLQSFKDLKRIFTKRFNIYSETYLTKLYYNEK